MHMLWLQWLLQVFPDRGCKREIALLKKNCICGMMICISDYKVKKRRKGDKHNINFIGHIFIYVVDKIYINIALYSIVGKFGKFGKSYIMVIRQTENQTLIFISYTFHLSFTKLSSPMFRRVNLPNFYPLYYSSMHGLCTYNVKLV